MNRSVFRDELGSQVVSGFLWLVDLVLLERCGRVAQKNSMFGFLRTTGLL